MLAAASARAKLCFQLSVYLVFDIPHYLYCLWHTQLLCFLLPTVHR